MSFSVSSLHICFELTISSMLFHTARLSLNRPLVNRDKRKASASSHYRLISDAIEVCDTSVETILGIIRRFGSRHSLKNAPLVFVHGAVAAVDVTLEIGACSLEENQPRPAAREKFLSALDAALEELSYTWTIAQDARRGLQHLLGGNPCKIQAKYEERSTALSSSESSCPEFFDFQITDLGTEFGPNVGQRTRHFQTPPPLDMELLGTGNFEIDISTMFPSGEQSSDFLWDPLIAGDDGSTTSWTGSQDSSPHLCGP